MATNNQPTNGLEHWYFDSNNLLYPREDKNERKLMFACRNCEYQEQAENVCVYRHEIVHAPSYVFIAIV